MGRLGWGWRPVQSQSYHSLGLCVVPSGQAHVVQGMGAVGGQRGTLAWCKDEEGHVALDTPPVPLHSAAWASSDVDIPPTRLTKHWDRLAQVCVLRPSGICALGSPVPSWQTHTLSRFWCPCPHGGQAGECAWTVLQDIRRKAGR